ncbi:hypothetical protein jhhlp_002184 [Lomentospora prolificans]|uniref:Carboxylesterase family protein n=1 Tax=Lomentospora prolificans TaxID=41688 RepID=A0A2N3NDD7_9PEZI|nr:hypothetical protein jhhlp_002184 [Lomentospora prolificans]
MATLTPAPRPDTASHHTAFSILDDNPTVFSGFVEPKADSSTPSTPDRNPASVAHIRALQETCVNVVQNHSDSGNLEDDRVSFTESSPTSLTVKFGKLRIASFGTLTERSKPGAEADSSNAAPSLVPSKRLPLRPSLALETFEPPSEEQLDIVPRGAAQNISESASPLCSAESPLEPISEEIPRGEVKEPSTTIGPFQDHPLMQLPTCLPSIENQVAKLQAGQYEYSISYPQTVQPGLNIDADENESPSQSADKKKIVYGCIPMRRNAVSRVALGQGIHMTNTITMIASPLEHECLIQEEPKVLVDPVNPAVSKVDQVQLPSTPLANGGTSTGPSTMHSLGSVNGFTKSVTPSPAGPKFLSIEDSLEALDRLEEELEAVNAMAHFGQVPSPEIPPLGRSPNGAHLKAQRPGKPRVAASTAKRPSSSLYAATVRVKPTDSGRAGSGRSRSLSVGAEDREASKLGKTQSPSKSPARKPIPRPASLAPPKPLAKSNRPRTVPTFELPGEAIARKLKEKKEARLSMQLEAGQSPLVAKTLTPQRSKSSRVLPRPTFELPGEAISRRKREQREAQIRAQEEEERKRREFKARPIKAGVMQPSSTPRETIASRARQAKKAQEENTASMSTSMKRLSLAATPSSLTVSPVSRGRTIATSPSQLSRATSVSASSVSGSGKRSTISAEDAVQQKLRGKEILARDNRYANDRERERAEREMLAKLAREQAAERSRQLSREWAEKQRRKAAAAGVASSSR